MIYVYLAIFQARWFLNHWRSTTLSAIMSNCLFLGTRSEMFIECGSHCNGWETNWLGPSFNDINNTCQGWSLFSYGSSVLGFFLRSSLCLIVTSSIPFLVDKSDNPLRYTKEAESSLTIWSWTHLIKIAIFLSTLL